MPTHCKLIGTEYSGRPNVILEGPDQPIQQWNLTDQQVQTLKLLRLLMKAHIHTYFSPCEESCLLDCNAVWCGESQPIFPKDTSFLSTGLNSKSSKRTAWRRQQTELPSPNYTVLYARRKVVIPIAVRTPKSLFGFVVTWDLEVFRRLSQVPVSRTVEHLLFL
jgi:hypothetical protein